MGEVPELDGVTDLLVPPEVSHGGGGWMHALARTMGRATRHAQGGVELVAETTAGAVKKTVRATGSLLTFRRGPKCCPQPAAAGVAEEAPPDAEALAAALGGLLARGDEGAREMTPALWELLDVLQVLAAREQDEAPVEAEEAEEAAVEDADEVEPAGAQPASEPEGATEGGVSSEAVTSYEWQT